MPNYPGTEKTCDLASQANGKNKFFEHWEDAQGYWFEHSQIPHFLDLILVKDKKVSKEKIKAKGFV